MTRLKIPGLTGSKEDIGTSKVYFCNRIQTKANGRQRDSYKNYYLFFDWKYQDLFFPSWPDLKPDKKMRLQKLFYPGSYPLFQEALPHFGFCQRSAQFEILVNNVHNIVLLWAK